MIKQLTKIIAGLGLAAFILIGCKPAEDPLPQLLAGYTSTSLGLTLTDNNGTVAIELSRVDPAATTLTLKITDEVNATYGTHYTTEPAATNGEITVEIAAGETSANLVINKLQNPDFEQVISFNITIETVSNNGIAGTNNVLAVSFEENPTAAGGLLAPEVGGPTQPNQVFIDLSKQSLTTVQKDTWDLAFSTGADFRVMLNYATYSMARATDQTDLAEISDILVTANYKTEMSPGITNSQYMDDPAGNLTKTAISEISAADANNMVYVINRGQFDGVERGFMKIRITQSGSDYVITYGNINDTDGFTSVTIPKTTDHEFVYFSLDTGIVDVAPADAQWDFAMTTFLNEFENNDGDVFTYRFNDFSINNHNHVKMAKVDVTESLTYDTYTTENLATTTLANDRLAIGSSWRKFDFATFTFAVNADVFYIIEDTEGNTYKLKFTKMLNATGDRGYPEFVYELL